MSNRCVIYTRVSSKGQAAGGKTSLADQERSCRILADERGWQVLEVVQDKLTGTNADRPGLTRVRKLVETGEVNHVVVWDTGRFMRDLNLAQLVQAELKIAGAEIHFLEQPRTGNDLADAIMRTINYATDQMENDKRRVRTLPKRLDALRAGRWIFPPPYGYRL
ncbi:MAG: recombinase family protein [Chloroflexi bacterium]|nr:recombinase family protein [Chloroflexota bacterium]